MVLHVLITNLGLWPPSGTSVYVRDLALELQRQGHVPIVLSSTVGDLAHELHGAGIVVTDSLAGIRATPDIIHGHHRAPTLAALRHWPTVPAIYVCHDHTSRYDETPIDPSIRRYLGVSRVCVQRLLREGAPAGRTGLVLNFVDLARFVPRGVLPELPRHALVFSNYAHEGNYLPAVVEACQEAGLELDIVGAAAGRIAIHPERLLGQYDIVFAKGKAAMEAMAVGAAVILCDVSGAGPLVTSTEFDRLRPLNFGFETLRDSLRVESLTREIARYDAQDAARVREMLRSTAGLVTAVEGLVSIYREAIAAKRTEISRPRSVRWSTRESLILRLFWQWGHLTPARRAKLEAIPGARFVKKAVRPLLRKTGL